MKMHSKLIAAGLTILALLFSVDVKSQTTPAKAFVLSLGINAGIPTGNASTYTAFILGGDIRLQYGLSDKLALTFTTGGYHFFPKSGFGSYGVGPIKLGIKSFFAPNYYFGLEAGAGVEVTESDGFGQTKLLLSPGVGYANERWDVGVRYEDYSGEGNNYGQVALHVAYGFRIFK